MSGRPRTSPPARATRGKRSVPGAAPARKPGRAAQRNWAVFLDRDGTLFHLVPYLRDPRQARLYNGVGAALRMLRDAGARLVVVTNQAGVARGLMTRRDVDRLNRLLRELLAGERVKLDRVEVCPHHPDFTGPCSCRKPAPGMILGAARALGVDPAESWMIGDSASDLEAGEAAGCRTGLVLTGYGSRTRATPAGRRAKRTGGTLRALAGRILAYRERGRR